MRFRQRDVTERKLAVLEVFLICFLSYELFWLIFVAKSYAEENWLFVAGIIIFGYSLFSPKAYVVIDEKGILCERKGKTEWEFTWDEISHLKKSRYPGAVDAAFLDIKLTDEASYIHRNLRSTVRCGFQYGEKARKALDMYCRCEIILF
ncbi:MAG: hypothetical protein IKM61_06855 [Eubacteriaceae bacterium]|nr:hypothetical protein [Eubacteriaceae bacterium]